MNALLAPLFPTQRNLIINLVRDAGVDVSEWSDFAGGASRAASNPKFCYEWSFMQGRTIVLNLWFENMVVKDGQIVQRLNLKEKARKDEKTMWRDRALKFDHALRTAYTLGLPFRAIICSGLQRSENVSTAKPSKVEKRMLDPKAWAVASYNSKTGECVVQRNFAPLGAKDVLEPTLEETAAFEGELRERFSFYRTRERSLRELKIEQVRMRNNGHLVCEVPNCGFDFFKTYGSLGSGFAEVHHKFPLKEAPDYGRTTTLDDLIVVCCNCHAMIHRFGDCKPVEFLIKRKASR